MLGCHALLLALGGAFIAMRGGDVGALTELLPGAGVKAAFTTMVLWVIGRKTA